MEPAFDEVTQSSSHLNLSTEKQDSANIFILKEVDRLSKRKHESADLDGNETHSSPIALNTPANINSFDNTVEDASAAKAEVKARRKEQKRQKKALREVESDVQVEPFDYANADSVLHAKPDKHQANGAAGSQRILNPYAKALDGPQGLKRLRKETAGKSFTFNK